MSAIAQTNTYKLNHISLFQNDALFHEGTLNVVFKVDEDIKKIESILPDGRHLVEKILSKEKAEGESNTIRYTASARSQNGKRTTYGYYFIDKFNRQITFASISVNKEAKGIKQNLKNYIVYQY